MEWLKDNAGLVIEICLALFIVGGWIWNYFNKAYKLKRNNEVFHDTVGNHTKQIADMDTRHKDDYKQINTKIDTLTNTLNTFVGETKKDNQVSLREKINYFYKLTLQKGYILEKDSKDYHYALDRYKANDGNSYILDDVEPRMKEFKVFLLDEDGEEYVKKVR